ncbi:hypothetical protein [Photobacterium kasasachensis]|uniref:hypothetical protein n=1 Tax=Photobacterium kasasachensis TaxID=2910240 RepID=UPI003D139D95
MKIVGSILSLFIMSSLPIGSVLAKTDFNERFLVEETIYNPCTMEDIEAIFIIHFRGGVHEDGSGGEHVSYQEHSTTFHGIGSDSGDRYQLHFFEIGSYTDPLHRNGNNFGGVARINEKVLVIHTGPSSVENDDWVARYTEHQTRNADGVPTSFRVSFDHEFCH